MFSGQGLAQDLGPGRGRKTYPGGRGMGCDYNIIDHLEKFSQFALKKAYFNCKFCGNSPEVAQLVRREGRRGELTNWVIMVTIGPRADHDHDYPVGDFSTAAAVAARPANSSSSSASSASSPGQITEKFRLAAMEENFSKWSIMNGMAHREGPRPCIQSK